LENLKKEKEGNNEIDLRGKKPKKRNPSPTLGEITSTSKLERKGKRKTPGREEQLQGEWEGQEDPVQTNGGPFVMANEDVWPSMGKKKRVKGELQELSWHRTRK